MSSPENKIEQINLTNQHLSLPEHRKTPPLENIHYTPKELIENHIRTERDETINLHKIYIDFKIVDQSHAEELGKSMKESRGQLSRILVRARLENDEVHYDILDGFHRTLGKIKEGFDKIDARVIYDCSDQEMYDIRILSANSVKSIQFARLAQWITKSFEASDFSQHIDVCQAFGLTINDSNRSYNANKLNSQEIEDLKKWVIEKSKLWERSPIAIYNDLRLMSISNPDLVKTVKDANNGTERAKYLTKEKLRQIADRFPGENNFHLQKIIAAYITKYKIPVSQVKDILNNLETRSLSGLSDKNIINIIKSTSYENSNFKVRHRRSKNKQETPHPEIIQLRSELEQAKATITQQSNRIVDLEKALENNSTTQNTINRLSAWINNSQFPLSENEKKIIKYFLYHPHNSNIFSQLKNLSNYPQLKSLIQSAINKKILLDDKNK